MYSIYHTVQNGSMRRLTCTAMYRPGMLNDSNMISARYSRFSGVFNGGSVCGNTHSKFNYQTFHTANTGLMMLAQLPNHHTTRPHKTSTYTYTIGIDLWSY